MYVVRELLYRGALLIRKRTSLGPYRRPMPRFLRGPGGIGVFLWARYPCTLTMFESSDGPSRLRVLDVLASPTRGGHWKPGLGKGPTKSTNFTCKTCAHTCFGEVAQGSEQRSSLTHFSVPTPHSPVLLTSQSSLHNPDSLLTPHSSLPGPPHSSPREGKP